MVTILVEISKYVLLAIMVFFTVETYMILQRRDDRSRRRIMRNQIGLMVLFDLVAFLIMYAVTQEREMLMMLVMVIGYILVVQILYRIIYRKASLVLLNTMCMLLSVGFVIQSRLGLEMARKQFLIAAFSTLLCFAIPVFIRRVRWVARLTWVYAVLGILLLAGVFLFGRVTGGANLSLTIGGISFQFSEFVKITVVLFMAGMLQERHDFRTSWPCRQTSARRWSISSPISSWFSSPRGTPAMPASGSAGWRARPSSRTGCSAMSGPGWRCGAIRSPIMKGPVIRSCRRSSASARGAGSERGFSADIRR